jgi:Raf kinase inhibitor-like YbhB/YbcL family protein
MGARLSRCDRGLGWAGLRAAAAVLAASMLGGCGLLAGPSVLQQEDDPQVMTVASPEFSQTVPMPPQYTCHGAGESPPLSWSGAPPGTKALALVMDDAGAPITPYVYWIVFNISPETPDIQAGRIPMSALVAYNSKGTVSYAPPCPDHPHQYRFTIYALNAVLPLRNGASLPAVFSAIAAHAIGRGRLSAYADP